jgi:alkylation response protein AidB-like acyl-CoA dehydrogenase
VLVQLLSDQEFFRETTAKFLKAQAPAGTLRELRDDAAGFSPDYWCQGAELGWTSLLVSEDHGGGSISGQGLVDLTVVAHEFGRAAAPGPLVATNVVAAALSAAGTHTEVLAGLLDGSQVAAWCHAEAGPFGRVGLEVEADGDELVLRGVKRPVEAAAQASHLLVTGRTGDGLTQVLVPADAPGVSITPMQTVDLTRRFAQVAFDGVRVPADAAIGQVGKAEPEVERQLLHALAIVCAEQVGAMETAFEMTLEWAFDRYSFGRPLASYQEIKHRFADMASWLQASHAIADEAAAAVAAASPKASVLASAAKSYIGQYGAELMQDCVQLHGGIGVTFEHDVHLYFRRHTVDLASYGTPTEHRRRITDLVDRGGVA